MANDDLFDDDFEDDSNLVKKLRTKIDELSARAKELEAENNKYVKETRKRTLADMLTQRGYAAKVSTFVPNDLELTDEAVDSWLSEVSDIFLPVNGSTEAAPADAESKTVVVNNAAEAEAIRRMQAAEAAGGIQVNPNDVLQRINSAQNMDELVAALRGNS